MFWRSVHVNYCTALDELLTFNRRKEKTTLQSILITVMGNFQEESASLHTLFPHSQI